MNETRQKLLDATRGCVRRAGLARTTSREITTEAGVNLAAITYHFGSKDDLVAEALLTGLREWVEPALVELTGADDPATGMLSAVQTLLDTFEGHREEASAHLEALVQSPRQPVLRTGVIALWAELRGHLAGQLTDLRRQGALPEWIEPGPMSALLVAVASGIVLQATVDPDGATVDAMASQFTGLLLSVRS